MGAQRSRPLPIRRYLGDHRGRGTRQGCAVVCHPARAQRHRVSVRTSRLVDRWARARSDVLLATVVVSTFIATYSSVVRFRPLFAPDTSYYGAMALWFGGESQQGAVRQVIERRLQSGWSTPPLLIERLFGWGLVQPRVVLPALSVPFVKIWGIDGLVVVPALALAALIGVLTWMLARRWGRLPAVATVVLVMCSWRIMFYGGAMLTESLSALWGALILVAAWQYQRRGGWPPVAGMVLLTILSGFTRQASLIPAAAFLAAWLVAILLRSRPNGWGVPALAVTVTSLTVQLLQNRLFPTFSQLQQVNQFQANTKTGSLGGALGGAPKLAAHILKHDLHTTAQSDPALLILITLATVSVVVFWRRSESHLLLGALAGIAVYNVATGTPVAFRYAMPGLVFFATSVALLIARTDLRHGRPGEDRSPAGYSEAGGQEIPVTEVRDWLPTPADDKILVP